MHILLVAGPGITLKQPYNSGIEAFIVSLANQLTSLGHSVDVLAEDSEEDALFAVKNDPLDELDIDNYDIIHYNLHIPELYKIAARLAKPSIVSLHSPANPARIKTYRQYAKNSAVSFIAVSDRIQQQWEPVLCCEIPVIRNGIDLNRWSLKEQAGGDYLLWSARITAEKNVTAAIELAQNQNCRLKIAGRIVDQAYFDKRVRPYLNDNIEYLGHLTQPELNEVAKHASAYLATASWQEPFGLAILEMLACGVDVIGFETAIPSDLQHTGVSVVASNDWRDLIEPLHNVGAFKRQHYRDFAATMSAEKTAQQYLRQYHAKYELALESL